MAQDTKLNVHDITWHFSVTDPRLHTKGFTVYKVSCKSFHVKSPELLTEIFPVIEIALAKHLSSLLVWSKMIVCWKRYNDFKALYKSLMALHKAQNRSDLFPELAKPKIFGRFSETVIERRRESAAELLNFISTQPHLYKSSVFKQFLEEGRIQSDFNKRGSLTSSRPSNLNIISGGLKVDADSKQSSVPPCPKVEPDRELKLEESTSSLIKLEQERKEHTAGLLHEKCSLRSSKPELSLLEGTWNFPQVADNISLGSSIGDEIFDTDDESLLAASLPEADLVCFASISPCSAMTVSGGSSRSMSGSTSWLREGLNVCTLMGSEAEGSHGQGKTESGPATTHLISEYSDEPMDTIVDTKSGVFKTKTSSSLLEKIQADLIATVNGSTAGYSIDLDLEECDPTRRMSQSSGSSKAECGRGDLDLSVELQMRSSSFGSDVVTSSRGSHDTIKLAQDKLQSSAAFSSRSLSIGSHSSVDSVKSTDKSSKQLQTSKNLLKKIISAKPVFQRPRSVTEQSVSTMSLDGKDDYIYRAANQICKAQNSEANGDYEVAFAYYKSGVGILLHGVQGDTNKFRRDMVRRKTAQYLMKAEDLFNRYLANENFGEPRWGTDSFLSPSLDPSFAFIRGSAKELRNFQVLGTIDKVILVRHKDTDEIFIIKSISKSTLDTGSTHSILPTSCPYMVSLHRFYETEDSVFLLLQYANGGKLWTYIAEYLNCDKSSHAKQGVEKDALNIDWSNIYSGTHTVTVTHDKTVKQHHHVLKDFLNKGKENSRRDFEQSAEGNLENREQYLQSAETLRFPMLNEEINESSLEDELVSMSSQNKSSNVDSIDHGSYNQGILNVSDLNEVPTCGNKILPLHQRLSECSDDCSIYEQVSNVILPVLLPDKDTDHHSIQNNQTSFEASVINKDSEDSHHNFSVCEKIGTIPINTEENNSSTYSFSSQVIAYGAFPYTRTESLTMNNEDLKDLNCDLSLLDSSKFAPTFNSQDIIRQSKELLMQVEKVLTETNDKTGEGDDKFCENHSESKQISNTSNVTAAVHDIYEKDRLSDAGGTNSSDLKTISQSGDRKCHVSNGSSLFRQTSTPRKLSISHMTRSASFEYDLKTPLRNRAKTVSDSFEHLDSDSVVPVQIPESFIRKWMAQIVTAVARLHLLGVVCRDLKPSNILLGDGGQVYLTYFCSLGHGDREFDWEAKDNLYAAPEVGSVNKYDKSCDWWSVGALLYELVVGRSLSECHPEGINSHTCLHIPTFVSNETRGLLEGLLCHNPNERLGSRMAGSEEVKAHPFFAGVDWHALEYA